VNGRSRYPPGHSPHLHRLQQNTRTTTRSWPSFSRIISRLHRQDAGHRDDINHKQVREGNQHGRSHPYLRPQPYTNPPQSKHLVNIFKDAKEAYHEKKAEIKAEIQAKNLERLEKRLLKNGRIHEIERETASQASRRRKHRSRSIEAPSRTPLTERNLEAATQVSVARSHHGSQHGSMRSSRHNGERRGSGQSPTIYRPPYHEDDSAPPHPDLPRRHTEALDLSLPHRPHFPPPARSLSSPLLRDGDENIDMHLAYGDLPYELAHSHSISPIDQKAELKGLMTRLDKLMLEASCLQHSATHIIASLQANPEAMAAVALTLAEISNLVTKLGPGVLGAIKSGSPAIFALLASPQFLIAGGLAVGVTVVMFGGYKIVKKIRAEHVAKVEAGKVEEALVYEGDLSSIECWRRGIAEEEARSVAVSVEGEFITPEAVRIKKERIRERAKDERDASRHGRSERTNSAGGDRGSVSGRTESTIRRKPVPSQAGTRSGAGESVRSESAVKASSSRRDRDKGEKKVKKSNALTVFFKKGMGRVENEKSRDREREKRHRPPSAIEAAP
jgi:hypothetical protein